MKTFKIFIPLLLFLFPFYGCAQNESVSSVTVKEFKEMIKNNDSTMIILDVRTDAELTGALPKIEGALHIPVQQLEERVDELEKYKDKEIVVVCRTQNRSSKAAEFLDGKGYDAKFVIGGMYEYYKK